ncbi:hypothetical protein D3C85_1618090 [compost metagenome]
MDLIIEQRTQQACRLIGVAALVDIATAFFVPVIAFAFRRWKQLADPGPTGGLHLPAFDPRIGGDDAQDGYRRGVGR